MDLLTMNGAVITGKEPKPAVDGKKAKLIVRLAEIGTGKSVEVQCFDEKEIEKIQDIPLYVPVTVVVSWSQEKYDQKIFLRRLEVKTDAKKATKQPDTLAG